MGKIYKNLAPIVHSSQTTKVHHTPQHSFVLPIASVIPMEEFDNIFLRAEKNIDNGDLIEALQDLVNLEVTKFDHLPTHELLADLFLKLNQIDLAKEQCQICANLINKQFTPSISFSDLKSFDQLVKDAGNIKEVHTQYLEIMNIDINDENFHEGTKIALNLATLLIADNKYKEAEQILINYRDRYLMSIKIN